jgi:hypothetical protein
MSAIWWSSFYSDMLERRTTERVIKNDVAPGL